MDLMIRFSVYIIFASFLGLVMTVSFHQCYSKITMFCLYYINGVPIILNLERRKCYNAHAVVQ